MKREKYKSGKIYKFTYADGDFDIFRATKDLKNCSALSIWYYNDDFQYHDGIRDYNVTTIRETTEEEKLWFEYCESFCEYRTKEEAIDNMYARQFVQEYLTE